MESIREIGQDIVQLENWVDEAVMSFIIDMKYKLRLNNHKGHWKEYATSHLLTKLKGEFDELVSAAKLTVTGSDQRELVALIHECADVANFAMMIADNAKRTMRKIDERKG